MTMFLITGGSLLALLGLTLRALAARSSAAQRHAILAATTIGLLLLPLVRLAGPQFRLRLLPPPTMSESHANDADD